MKSCPICRNDKLDTLYEAERVPIMQNLLYPSYEEAKEIKTADIVLTQCRTCGFVFNSTFIPDMIQYDQSYDNEQGHSSFFSHHVDSVIDIITTNFSFDATIVEIGTGKGDFFEKLLLQGFNNIHGFDPAYEGNNPKITKEYFNINHKDIDADLIILRHTLEHINDPHSFLKQLACIVNKECKIFIEVPDFEWIASKNAFWDIFYEHCNYFSANTFCKIFSKVEIFNLFNGQYLGILASLEDLRVTPDISQPPKLYGAQHFSDLEKYKKMINQNKCIVWGAGAKGVSFLNLFDNDRKLCEYIIDINHNKQHKFIGKTGHKVIGVEEAKRIMYKNKIEYILIMNENYKLEIIEMVKDTNMLIYTIGED